ncbi:hypothetical protein ACFLY7_01365 [Patescibacteria group bacterium]
MKNSNKLCVWLIVIGIFLLSATSVLANDIETELLNKQESATVKGTGETGNIRHERMRFLVWTSDLWLHIVSDEGILIRYHIRCNKPEEGKFDFSKFPKNIPEICLGFGSRVYQSYGSRWIISDRNPLESKSGYRYFFDKEGIYYQFGGIEVLRMFSKTTDLQRQSSDNSGSSFYFLSSKPFFCLRYLEVSEDAFKSDKKL